jgi:hypothetical protein
MAMEHTRKLAAGIPSPTSVGSGPLLSTERYLDSLVVHEPERAVDRRFYRRWVWANGWAEAVGLGTTLVIGWALAPALQEGSASVVFVVMGAAVAILLGALLEGVVVGVAQQRVLRRRLPKVPPHAWVGATVAGAGVAWLLGILPSTVLALTGPPALAAAASASPSSEPTLLMALGLAAILGCALGALLGLAQWLVLRRRTSRAERWIRANAVAWAIGMPIVFTGMDLVPWSEGALLVIPAICSVCWVTGLVVGAIHGRQLVRLTRDATPRGRAA